MELRYGESECDEQLEQGDIVWAKITGYPWWPAVVTDGPLVNNSSYRVEFINDNTHAFLPEQKLCPYFHMRQDVDVHQHMARGLRRAILTADRISQKRMRVENYPRQAAAQVEVNANPLQQLLQSTSKKQKTSTALHAKPSASTILLEEQQESQSSPQEQSESHSQASEEFSFTQRERYVASLLQKYHLTNIPNNLSREESRESCKPNKRKIIRKIAKNKVRAHQVQYNMHQLVAKKINQLLKTKKFYEEKERKRMSLSLCQQITGSGENNKQELLRMLKWIEISPGNTISSYYQNWTHLQSEKEKFSNMTSTE